MAESIGFEKDGLQAPPNRDAESSRPLRRGLNLNGRKA